MARVFVGVPTYNRPQLVRATVASVLAQEFGDFRMVVSDNCSDGETGETVRRFVEGLGDPRVTFHRQAVNGGEYGQGRFFFAASRDAEMLMILHDDDVLEPGCLAAGVAALDRNPAAALFAANAHIIDVDGHTSPEQTRRHLRFHRRDGVAEGAFDVLERHLASGFAWISGTLFRRAALERSGFVDADCHGNYPFECNIFLRLGEIGSTGWFSPRDLMGVRMHGGSFRSQRWIEDPALVSTSIRLWAKRRFTGAAERRRRAILGRLYRAQAVIDARAGATGAARAALALALRTSPASLRGWALLPLLLVAPRLLRHGPAGAPA